jgi:hypothetical protein
LIRPFEALQRQGCDGEVLTTGEGVSKCGDPANSRRKVFRLQVHQCLSFGHLSTSMLGKHHFNAMIQVFGHRLR